MVFPFPSSWRTKAAARAKKRRAGLRRYRPTIDALEQRSVPSITFSGPGNTGVCTLTGTDGPDDFVIQMKPSDPIMTVEFSDDNGASFVDAALAAVAAVQADGLGGRDQLIIHNDIGLVGKFGCSRPGCWSLADREPCGSRHGVRTPLHENSPRGQRSRPIQLCGSDRLIHTQFFNRRTPWHE